MGLLDEIDLNKLPEGILDNPEFAIEESATQQEYTVDPKSYSEEIIDVAYEPISDIEVSAHQGEEDTELTEVECRLAKAQLYKQFITGSIFDGEGPIVQEVSTEFRSFARKQLQELMGLKQPEQVIQPPVQVFTDIEVQALKALTNRIIQNPKVLETKQSKPKAQPVSVAPQERKQPVTRPAPEQPKYQPAPIVKPKQSKPTLMKRQVPDEVPQQKQSVAKQTKPSVSTNRTFSHKANVLSVPKNGDVIEEGGKKYKVEYATMLDVNEFGLMDSAKIMKLGDGDSCVLSNGVQVLKDKSTVYKVCKFLETNATPISNRVPFPSIDQMPNITLQTATMAARQLPTIDKIMRGGR